MLQKIPFRDKISYGYSLARVLAFTAEQLSLPVVEFLTTGKTKKKIDPRRFHKAHTELLKLLKKDSENIAQGYYPLEVLKPEKVGRHLRRYPKILLDGYFISKRRDKKKSADFD